MAVESSCFLVIRLLVIAELGFAFTAEPVSHALLSSKLNDATHVSITEAGINHAVHQYFIEKKDPNATSPPSGPNNALNSRLPPLVSRNGANLIDIFRTYYGSDCSLNLIPHQFAVLEILVFNARMDFDPDTSHRTDFHFDAEKFDESNANVIAMREKAKMALAVGQLSYARAAFGRALHTIQDFYSHSNWVEMGKTEPNPGVGNDAGFGLPIAGPDTRTCKPCPAAQGSCRDNIVVTDQLTSGYTQSIFPGDTVSRDAQGNPVLKPENVGKCSHGGPLDKSANEDPIGGINKDTGDPSASPHWYLHHQAADLAKLATAEFVTAFRSEVGDEKFEKFLALDEPQCQGRRRRRYVGQAPRQTSAQAVSLLAETVQSPKAVVAAAAYIRKGEGKLTRPLGQKEVDLIETAQEKSAVNYWCIGVLPVLQDIGFNVAILTCLTFVFLSAILAVVLFKVSFGDHQGRKASTKCTRNNDDNV